MARRAGQPVAAVVWTTAAIALAAAVATAWLGLAGGGAAGGSVKPVILTAVWVVPGVLITRARPGSVLGWLALGEALLFAAAGWATSGSAAPLPTETTSASPGRSGSPTASRPSLRSASGWC